MKNWMLVCCCERDIEPPSFFNTYEEAYDRMRRELAEFMDLELVNLNEYLVEPDRSCGLTKMFAWGESHGNCCDWQIFNIEGRI